MMQQCMFLILAVLCLTAAKQDRTQKVLVDHLARTPNKTELISNDKFTRQMFDIFRKHHPRRKEASDNETRRYQIFQGKLNEAVDADDSAKNRTFTVGLNKFSDWNATELQILRGNRPPSPATRPNFAMAPSFAAHSAKKGKKGVSTASSTTTAIFDYTTRVSAVNTSVPIIGPVRDQGQCGSCYAFSMITLLSAQYAFQYGKTTNMTEQQIVDCSTGDFGCSGGYFDTSFAYFQSYNWYTDNAVTYPYRGVVSTCAAKQSGGWSVGNLTYRLVQPGNVTAMKAALTNFGPLWISLYVGSDCSG